MKKLMIAVAILGMAGTSSIKAEGFNVDFDRGSFKAVSFMEAVQANDTCKTNADSCAKIASVPEQIASEAMGSKADSTKMYELDKAGMQMLHKEIADRSISSLSQDVLKLVNDEKIGILYNNEKVYFTRVKQDGAYMTVLESRDVQLIGLLQKLAAQPVQHLTRWNDTDGHTCKKWETHDVCVNQNICRMICSNLPSIIGCVLTEFCDSIPKCTPVAGCVEWD